MGEKEKLLFPQCFEKTLTADTRKGLFGKGFSPFPDDKF